MSAVRARRRAIRVPMPARTSDSGWRAPRRCPWTGRSGRPNRVGGGRRTWERLAGRGVWVNGCADGLGDNERANIDALAGRPVVWRRLTHAESGDPDALATYVVEEALPADLSARTHFFWTSGSAFARALARQPAIRSALARERPGAHGRAPFVRIWALRAALASGWTTNNGTRHVTS